FARCLAPGSPLFPYTTLFRSERAARRSASRAEGSQGSRSCSRPLQHLLLDDPFPVLQREVARGRVEPIDRQELRRLDATPVEDVDRKSTRLNSSHEWNPYADF